MHNFCLLNIKRPVLSSVFSLMLVVFGLYTFFQISTRELPKDLQPPVVEIRTNYTGASPAIISSEISEPIELAVGVAEGIKSIIQELETGSQDFINGCKSKGIITDTAYWNEQLHNIECKELKLSENNFK